jgi:hypothetical protein
VVQQERVDLVEALELVEVQEALVQAL